MNRIICRCYSISWKNIPFLNTSIRASFQSTEQDDLISTTNEEQLLTTDVAFITTEQVTSDPVSTTGDLATSLTTSVSTPSLVLLPVLNPSFEIDMLGGFLARGHVQFWKASHGVLTSRPGSSDILLSGTHIPDGSQVLLLLHMTEVYLINKCWLLTLFMATPPLYFLAFQILAQFKLQ